MQRGPSARHDPSILQLRWCTWLAFVGSCLFSVAHGCLTSACWLVKVSCGRLFSAERFHWSIIDALYTKVSRKAR